MRNILRRADPSRGYLPPHARGRIVSITPGTIWLVTGIVVAVGILAYIVATAINILILLFIAIIFAEAIRPIMNWLRHRHIARPVGVLLIYLAIVGIVAFLVYLLLQPLIGQLSDLQQAIPHYLDLARRYFDQLQTMLGNNPQIARAFGQLEGQLGGLVTTILGYVLYIPVAIAGALVGIVAIAAMAFFWLTGTDALLPFVVGLFPLGAQARATDVFEEMAGRLGGYVRGVVFNMFVIGILSGTGDFLLGVPYAVLLGILAGLTEILPYIGPWIGGTAAVMVALLASGFGLGVEVTALYILIQVIEGHTLVPLVMNRAVHLNPLTVIVAVLIGGTLYGIVGGVLAVPVAAVIKVLVTEVLAPAARTAASHLSHNTAEPSHAYDDEGTPAPAP